MGVKCFLLESTTRVRRSLRRYNADEKARQVPGADCPIHGYHNAMAFIDVIERDDSDSYSRKYSRIEDFKDDPRWPSRCDCGYVFKQTDEWQVFLAALYKRQDNGEEVTLRDAQPGAIWDATWYSDTPAWCGPDGKALICKLPNGNEWHIDGRASNCTMPNDEVHKCWVRHGDAPNLTVDKNGNTCQAGAGSILSGNWHGFLRNGELVQA